MEVTKNNIEEYIHRFMEGETTNAEEQAIYRFFRTEEVPEHLKPYTEMFTWYEEGMPEEELSKPKTQPLWKRIPLEIWSTGIAAMLVIGIGLGIVLSFGDNQHEDWSCYEGSYVEVDGKRITDIETILPIILETLKGAEEIEQRTEARLTRIRSIEEYTREKENINTNF
jgi:hypothetical protein